MWIGGMSVAAVIVISGLIYVVDTFLAFHDPSDPLTPQAGLKAE